MFLARFAIVTALLGASAAAVADIHALQSEAPRYAVHNYGGILALSSF